ncbi:MAG: FHIPEP family type III secretion protein [Kofleriaceae bacterium]|nr:FHIPEP family type III secretion protein [Kofleriaceae bacterium]
MATIIIVVINLAGGLVIGMGERGMDAGTAVETYSILAVGDGLVAQLPALLVALAAALVVTRVAAADGERAIGDDIAAQLGAEPRAFFTAAALLAGLGVVPGLPTSRSWCWRWWPAASACGCGRGRPSSRRRARAGEPGRRRARHQR